MPATSPSSLPPLRAGSPRAIADAAEPPSTPMRFHQRS
jgi:hypothetical protein